MRWVESCPFSSVNLVWMNGFELGFFLVKSVFILLSWPPLLLLFRKEKKYYGSVSGSQSRSMLKRVVKEKVLHWIWKVVLAMRSWKYPHSCMYEGRLDDVEYAIHIIYIYIYIQGVYAWINNGTIVLHNVCEFALSILSNSLNVPKERAEWLTMWPSTRGHRKLVCGVRERQYSHHMGRLCWWTSLE